MENLQELSNQIDNIKEKLTDEEYKSLMDLSKEIFNKGKPKYIKCLVGTFKLNIYEKDDENEREELSLDEEYMHNSYDQPETHNIFITKNISFEEKIFKVINHDDDDDVECGIDVKQSLMCCGEYDMLKEKKYKAAEDDRLPQCDIIVYLCDM
jgi:hypothetical protein